jgi:hypothetical protein
MTEPPVPQEYEKALGMFAPSALRAALKLTGTAPDPTFT